MGCKECEERRRKLRQAILRGKIAEAAGHAVKGVAEMVGAKPAATAEFPVSDILWDDPELEAAQSDAPKAKARKNR